ncbi:MAG: hypothetical protein D6715_08005 [Calditrichaeota bacterium]|nr:MAG: hypothetical protein D6715_08005 [Calditrichota bacterium]
MRRIGIGLALMMFTTLALAGSDPSLSARVVERKPGENGTWQVTLQIRLEGRPLVLPADSQVLSYALNLFVENRAGQITQVHLLQRRIPLREGANNAGMLDSFQVQLVLKPGDAFLSVEPLNFPGYIKAIRKFDLLSASGVATLQTSRRGGLHPEEQVGRKT